MPKDEDSPEFWMKEAEKSVRRSRRKHHRKRKPQVKAPQSPRMRYQPPPQVRVRGVLPPKLGYPSEPQGSPQIASREQTIHPATPQVKSPQRGSEWHPELIDPKLLPREKVMDTVKCPEYMGTLDITPQPEAEEVPAPNGPVCPLLGSGCVGPDCVWWDGLSVCSVRNLVAALSSQEAKNQVLLRKLDYLIQVLEGS